MHLQKMRLCIQLVDSKVELAMNSMLDGKIVNPAKHNPSNQPSEARRIKDPQ
jgi:hypothetical protein